MSGYRFCRTDDVPLLVAACNRCYGTHFSDEPPMTVSSFRADTRELNLWASSCMVAFAGDEPIGVMLSAKRDTASLIHRIGVRPEHQRQGHGRHLLSSLSRKLSILGPPRLEVEIPARASGVRRFFEACGYEAEARYADFEYTGPTGHAQPTSDAADAIVSIGVDDVVQNGAFDETIPRAWERSLPTIQNRTDQLRGLALVSDLRIEAHLLHRPRPRTGASEIVALGCAPGDHGRALLGILVHHFCRLASGRVSIPRVSEREIDVPLLERWGFRRSGEHVGYVALATE